MLMAHTGGPYSVTNLTLAFDDEAVNSLPLTALTNGSYVDTVYAPVPILPGFTIPVYNTSLSVFDGSNPNGAWSLYVDDDSPGNDGIINQGWSLNISLVNPVNPIAQLALLVARSPHSVLVGDLLAYTITVTNAGPGDAVGVILTNTLPASAIVVSLGVSQGSVAQNTGGQLVCNLGTIAAGQTATLNITVIPTVAGTIQDTSTATTTSSNPFAPVPPPTINITPVIGMPPVLWQASIVGGTVHLVLSGQPGESYIIQTSTNLVSWTSISTNVAGVGGTFPLVVQSTNAPSQFYRSLHLPQ
jgi:uncharacterized repeat protein (TIGR01451 family)